MTESSSDSPRFAPATVAIHGGPARAGRGAPVAPPIVQSSTFLGGGPDDGDELLYTRYGNNPNQLQVGARMAELEGMEAGLALGSGMAAISLAALSLTRAGDHAVASRHLYGATRLFMESELPRRGVEVTFVDPGDLRAWEAALRTRTRFLYMEILANPTLEVGDPRPVAELARGRGLPLVLDATFATPVNFRGRDHGVDLVVHSATKYLGGHSDLVAGVVCGDPERVAEIRSLLKLYGPALDPHAAWLLDRGLRTLPVRMAAHGANAGALARWFREQPGVAGVRYPGLEGSPGHAIARELLQGFGGMLSVELEGGAPSAERFCRALELAVVAPSLGGVETLVSLPRLTSHRDLTAAQREDLGISEGLVRVSVGLEALDDLQADFGSALERARG